MLTVGNGSESGDLVLLISAEPPRLLYFFDERKLEIHEIRFAEEAVASVMCLVYFSVE